MSDIVHQAEQLAASGVPVFPLRENKRPATPHGFLDAVVDPAAVAPLWRRHPGTLIGVPTGAASGLDALDIDPRHGGDAWWLQHVHLIPATRMHRTRSGGLHVLFRHHDRVRNTESKIARGVDTRGQGGYICWWPASDCAVVHAPVVAWPSWLLTRLLREPPKPKPYSGPMTPLDSADAAHRLAERVLSRVANASEGQRHYTLRAAARTIGGLLDHLPFGRSEAVARLKEAARQAGARDLIGAEKTAEWGITRGTESPISIGGAAR